jgi:parvulin-like peptidyl-prolyl isomerase
MSLRLLRSCLGLPAAAVAALLCIAPSARGQDGDAVVLVNGRPITRSTMVDLLMEARGLQIMQQLIVLELAKEETRRLKIRVTPDDVQREFDRALTKIAPPVDAKGQALTDDEKEQSLEMLLQQKGITLTEFKIGMERNAHLRKVVEQRFRVDEATLREEFARLYGEKVEVRHIQVGDVSGLHEALNRLEKGTEFGDVARAVSQNPDTAPSGGLLAPFAFNEEVVAPVLREVAFSMKPGEVSKPIRVGTWWHILKLERRLPAPNVRFEDVRGQVEQSLRDHAIPEQMNHLVMDLFQKADVKVLDSKLKRKYEKLLKDNAAMAP